MNHAKLACRCLLFLLIVQALLATVIRAQEFKAIETRYSTIHFRTDDDLTEFGKKTAPASSIIPRDRENAIIQIRENTDRIVYRVRLLLDMYPQDFNINIYVYPAYSDLKEIYKEKGAMGSPPIAFYSQRTKTVYLSLEKITDRILAHEIAHGVINSYFQTPPPAQMQEILAQYVDKHLWD